MPIALCAISMPLFISAKLDKYMQRLSLFEKYSNDYSDILRSF